MNAVTLILVALSLAADAFELTSEVLSEDPGDAIALRLALQALVDLEGLHVPLYADLRERYLALVNDAGD